MNGKKPSRPHQPSPPKVSLVVDLVVAVFIIIYLAQPVPPVLQQELGVRPTLAFLSVSAVVLGLALADLPFGFLSDRLPVRPIILGAAGWSSPR
ncbi:hypothetical protein DFAR_2560004 [Desulfarculales bacterium]